MIKSLERQLADVYGHTPKESIGRLLNTLIGLYGISPERVREIEIRDTFLLFYRGKCVGSFIWIDSYPLCYFIDEFSKLYVNQYYSLVDRTYHLHLVPYYNPHRAMINLTLRGKPFAAGLLRFLDERGKARGKGRQYVDDMIISHDTVHRRSQIEWVTLHFRNRYTALPAIDYINRYCTIFKPIRLKRTRKPAITV